MKKQGGFTIIEVMLVVILISILAAIVIPRFANSTKRAKVQACEMNRSIINKQVELYAMVEATWPEENLGCDMDPTHGANHLTMPCTRDIGTNVNYFPDGIPTCPVDMTSYQLRPSPYHRVTNHREGAGTHIFENMKQP